MELDKLTPELIEFAWNEIGVDEKTLRSTEENEELRQDILDKLEDIEVEEVMSVGDGPDTKRGKLVYTLINILCYPMGDEDDDD